MKLYGYPTGSEDDTPSKLEEVTIAADPATLRLLAKFLVQVADNVEKYKDNFGHEHFEHFARQLQLKCRLVIVPERVEPDG